MQSRRRDATIRCAVAEKAPETFTYQAEVRITHTSCYRRRCQARESLRSLEKVLYCRCFFAYLLVQVNRLMDLIVNSLYSNKEVRQ